MRAATERGAQTEMGEAGKEEAGRRNGTCQPVRALFLYNAGSGALESALDSARKLARSPRACALCSVTHGVLGKRKAWSEIECSLELSVAYYHRDEIPWEARAFLQANGLRLPAVLFELADGTYRTGLTAEEILDCWGEPECLRNRFEASLNRLRSP